MILNEETKLALLDLAKNKGVYLEGNILKVVVGDDPQFMRYLDEARTRDASMRRKRLEITRQVQTQNLDLHEAHKKLEQALLEAENAKSAVEQDLSILQKKTQFRLMHRIVNLSLAVVASVGFIATAVYIFALSRNVDVEHIGTTWASLTGILLTNSFSILGTIMGVKYASERADKD